MIMAQHKRYNDDFWPLYVVPADEDDGEHSPLGSRQRRLDLTCATKGECKRLARHFSTQVLVNKLTKLNNKFPAIH